MTEQIPARINKLPFYFANVCCLAFAGVIVWSGHGSLDFLHLLFFAICGVSGAFFAVWPFLLEYRALLQAGEANSLSGAIEKIGSVEDVANRIAAATAQWQGVQEQAAKTTGAARQIAEQMAAEAAAFADFMKKSNDSEKGALRLEVEKLRRGEVEWLQIVVRILDHIYALNLAARRSGQKTVIDQLDQFQNACRDAARRIGVSPFVPAAGQPFDPQQHQLSDPQAKAEAGALVGDVMATGYTFQGRLVRPALVTLAVHVADGTPPVPVGEMPAAGEGPKTAGETMEEPTLL